MTSAPDAGRPRDGDRTTRPVPVRGAHPAPATTPATVPVRPARAPERPVVEGADFATVLDPGQRPRVVSVATGLWLAGVAAAGVAAGALWLEQERITARFAAMVVERDPTTAPDVVSEAARYAFLATVGGVVVVAVLHAVLALGMRTGRGWARTLLAITGVLGIAVAVLAQDLVADPARPLADDAARIALAVHAVLVVPAVVTMLLPSATRWFRRVRAVR